MLLFLLIKVGLVGNSLEKPMKVKTSFGDFDHHSISQSINLYSRKEWGHQLNKIFADASYYESYVKSKIKELKVPEELFYLPVVESRYINNSKSYVGAMGIWQFMKASAAPFGLQINTERDDRRDFMLATDAALRKLRWNYKKTGDWLLAIAAYNCGIGAVQRAMKAHNATTYWELHQANALPRETLNYIPKLLAVIYISQNPKSFYLSPPPAPIDWIKIPIPKPLNLKQIASISGVQYSILRKANQELIGDTTPSDGSTYFLKIPKKYSKKVTNAVKNYPSLFVNAHIKLDKYTKSLYDIIIYEKA